MIMTENTARFAGGKHLKGAYYELLQKSGFLSVRASNNPQEPKEKPEETVARILGALTGN